MKINIIGCGETAQLWDGQGYSIGVNDCWKYHKTNGLVVVNSPAKFERDRLDIIVRSEPDTFYSHLKGWKLHFPAMKEIKMNHWNGHSKSIRNGRIFHSRTSPLIAMSIAFNMGAKELVLWGVDFRTHKIYKEGTKNTINEIKQYETFCQALEEHGCKVYAGAEGTGLKFLDVQKTSTNTKGINVE